MMSQFQASSRVVSLVDAQVPTKAARAYSTSNRRRRFHRRVRHRRNQRRRARRQCRRRLILDRRRSTLSRRRGHVCFRLHHDSLHDAWSDAARSPLVIAAHSGERVAAVLSRMHAALMQACRSSTAGDSAERWQARPVCMQPIDARDQRVLAALRHTGANSSRMSVGSLFRRRSVVDLVATYPGAGGTGEQASTALSRAQTPAFPNNKAKVYKHALRDAQPTGMSLGQALELHGGRLAVDGNGLAMAVLRSRGRPVAWEHLAVLMVCSIHALASTLSAWDASDSYAKDVHLSLLETMNSPAYREGLHAAARFLSAQLLERVLLTVARGGAVLSDITLVFDDDVRLAKRRTWLARRCDLRVMIEHAVLSKQLHDLSTSLKRRLSSLTSDDSPTGNSKMRSLICDIEDAALAHSFKVSMLCPQLRDLVIEELGRTRTTGTGTSSAVQVSCEIAGGEADVRLVELSRDGFLLWTNDADLTLDGGRGVFKNADARTGMGQYITREHLVPHFTHDPVALTIASCLAGNDTSFCHITGVGAKRSLATLKVAMAASDNWQMMSVADKVRSVTQQLESELSQLQVEQALPVDIDASDRATHLFHLLFLSVVVRLLVRQRRAGGSECNDGHGVSAGSPAVTGSDSHGTSLAERYGLSLQSLVFNVDGKLCTPQEWERLLAVKIASAVPFHGFPECLGADVIRDLVAHSGAATCGSSGEPETRTPKGSATGSGSGSDTVSRSDCPFQTSASVCLQAREVQQLRLMTTASLIGMPDSILGAGPPGTTTLIWDAAKTATRSLSVAVNSTLMPQLAARLGASGDTSTTALANDKWTRNGSNSELCQCQCCLSLCRLLPP